MTPSPAPNIDFERPYTTVDVVIFSLVDDELQVLLVQRPDGAHEPFPGRWALPGGFVHVDTDDDLEACAKRKLYEKTGVDSPYLEQLQSWGGKKRDPRFRWSTTHVYFALLESGSVNLQHGGNSQAARWYPVTDWLSPDRIQLAFDHDEILDTAVDRLRSKVEYTSLPAYLLPEPFSLPQLQHAYELVLGREIDKSGFRTRALSLDDFLEVAVEKMDVGALKPAVGYRLRQRGKIKYFPRTLGRPKTTEVE